MSSGNLSSRQKMINMMYLVLMAMLALNVSREVLDAFGSINETMDRVVGTAVQKSKILYNDLKIKNENNPKRYAESFEVSEELYVRSNKIVDMLEEYKTDMIAMSGSRDESTGKLDYASMDGSQGSEYLFPGGDVNFGRGRELVDAIDEYSAYLVKVLDSEELRQQVKQVFSTKPVLNSDGVLVSWVKHRFEHYPLAAQIAFLSQIQADVRSAESDVLQSLLVGSLSTQMQVNNVHALVIPESTSVIKGNSFKAKVVLAAYDTTLLPDVYLYRYSSSGRRVGKSEEKIKVEGGKGVVQIPADVVGSHYWGGVVRLKNERGRVTEYEFKDNVFSVNAATAVVSADKMNVLYRGVKNPVSVSVPGISAGDVVVDAFGLTDRGNGKYFMDVTNFKGKVLDIRVSARIKDTLLPLLSKRYRIKDIPSPVGTVRGETDSKMHISNLKISTIGAEIRNFEFDLKLTVTGFSVKVPGRPTVLVKGNRFDERTRRIMSLASVGDVIVISDIKVKIPGNSRYRVKDVSPVLVTINGR